MTPEEALKHGPFLLPLSCVGPVETSLKEGARVRAFLSGGGLRVLRLERDGNLLGYGEHAYLRDAFRILGEDVAAGGRKYNEVYGVIEEHYFTGSSSPQDALDAWVRTGSKFSGIARGDIFTFQLTGFAQMTIPEEVLCRVRAGEQVEWENRGYRYRTRPEGTGWTTECVAGLEEKGNRGAYHWDVTHTGTGSTLQAAIDAAFSAPSVEAKSDSV